MSDTAARWITTTPEARLTSGTEKVSVRDSLAPGTRLLDEFEVLRVLGTGGFGIVYLARDHVLQREVAIKEYMPAVLARRGVGAEVAMRESTSGCARTFEKGLASFLGEARLLASFDHPALVKVYRFWRANGTAYMAMPYYPGQTLKDVRLQMLHPPREAWLHNLIAPLLGALELLHTHDVFHRDVAPDNILVLGDGRPVLLDFGCARRAVATGTQWFTAHLKPQFAPLEQYGEDEGVGQGPWTDLYSLGATLYFVVTGRAPVPSVVRAARDTLPVLCAVAKPSSPASSSSLSSGLSPRLLATIDWILALAPHDRPQDVATVRRALLGEIVPPPPSPRFAATAPAQADVASPTGGEPVEDGGVPSTPEPSGAPQHRGMRPGAALVLAVAGVITVGWGAFALEESASEAGPALARETLKLPEAIETPLPSRTPAIERAPLVVAVPVVASEPAPDEGQGSGGARAVERAPARLVEMSAPPPRKVAPPDVEKPTRPSKRGASRSVAKEAARAERAVCTADAGMLTAALCVLNPCRDPTQRTSAKCVDRQRAEAARLRRMASAG